MNKPVKLIDFGCAVEMDKDIDENQKVAGTYPYMAPEVGFNSLINFHYSVKLNCHWVFT